MDWQKARQLKRTSLLSRVHRVPPKVEAPARAVAPTPEPEPAPEPEITPAEDPPSPPKPPPATAAKKKETAAPPKKKGMLKSIYKAMIRSAFNKDKEAKPKKRPNMFTSPKKPPQ